VDCLSPIAEYEATLDDAVFRVFLVDPLHQITIKVLLTLTPSISR
jgi:hypothetical protein